MGGDKKMSRAAKTLALELPRQFEADQRPHTVAKERERPVEVRGEDSYELLEQARQPAVRWLTQSIFASRKLNRTHLDFLREVYRPGVEDRGPTSSIWETE
jgi:hypothetical protein